MFEQSITEGVWGLSRYLNSNSACAKTKCDRQM